jgi:large subunit ribosomal protein L10
MSKTNSQKNNHLLEKLRSARLEAGLTQVEASKKLKKPQSYLSKIERGERKIEAQKELDLAELTSKLKEAKSVVFTEYRGTTVKDIDKFRKSLIKENVFSKVYKVTLVKKALEANGVDASSLDYKTPVILSISNEEETAPARIIKGLGKDIKTVSMLAGLVDGKLVTKAQVTALADMPSKLELRAKLVGTINAPVSGFVNVLAGNLRGLINVLNAVAQKG